MSRLTVTLATQVLAKYPILLDLALNIPNMPMTVRKALLTLCRTQVAYDPRARAYVRLKGTLRIFFPDYRDPSTRQTNLMNLLQTAGDYLASPFYSGLISMLVRNMPLQDSSVYREMLEDAVQKELQAASSTYHPISLQWPSVLSYSTRIRHTTSLIPKYQPCPEIQDEVFKGLCGAKSRLRYKRFYPDYGRKTLGRTASEELKAFSDLRGYEYAPTTLGLEELYHHDGIQLSSNTEVRTAFKFNDLRPRVYYARGPSQYYSSRYTQDLFNVLVDTLPVTHRFERFLANSLPIDAGSTLFIYDYSAFTSTLHELHNFISELATFFRDVHIDVVDTYQGVIRRSLGEMLDEYNAACNIYPEYDVGNVYHESSWIPETRVHNTGMLGVPGNISSCTLLHGIHLMCLLMHNACKVVGDDAIGSAPDGVLQEILDLLSNIGAISMDKVERWSEDSIEEEHSQGWHYTKRPIDRVDFRVDLQSTSIIWPTVGNLHPSFGDPYHTVVYELDPIARNKKIAKALCTFALQFRFSFTLTEEERALANLFMRTLIRMTGLDGEKSGGARFLFPTCVEEGIDVDSWIDRMWYTSVTLPRFGNLLVNVEEFEMDIEQRCTMRRSLKLAKDLGYCVVSPVMDTFFVFSDPDRVKAFLLKENSDGSLVDFCLSSTCPRWLVDLVVDETCMILPSPSDQIGVLYVTDDEDDDE